MYKNIRDIREDSDIRQNVIAELLNVDRSVYSKYESGNLTFPIQTLIKLADFYDTSVDYLLR